MRHCLAHNSHHPTCMTCCTEEHGNLNLAWASLVTALTLAQQSCLTTDRLYQQALKDLATLRQIGVQTEEKLLLTEAALEVTRHRLLHQSTSDNP